jgi:hypothetical protein
LLGEIRLDTLCRLFKKAFGSWFFSDMNEGICRAKHVHHELRNRLGSLALLSRAVQRASNLLALNGHHHGDTN